MNDTAYGVHYGIRFDAGNGGDMNMGSGTFFFKIAGGFYNHDFDSIDNKWGFGGFATIGYEFAGGFNIEIGYQMAPKVLSIDNNGWYIAGSFRF